MSTSLTPIAFAVTATWFCASIIALRFWSNTAQEKPQRPALRRVAGGLAICVIVLGAALPKFFLLLREGTTQREAFLACVLILIPANFLLAFASRWATPHVNDVNQPGIQGWRVGVLVACGMGAIQIAAASLAAYRHPESDTRLLLSNYIAVVVIFAPLVFAPQILGLGKRARPIAMEETPLRDELERIAYLIQGAAITFEIVPTRSSRGTQPALTESEVLRLFGVGSMFGNRYRIPIAALQVLAPSDFTGMAALHMSKRAYTSTVSYRLTASVATLIVAIVTITGVTAAASLSSKLKLDLGWSSLLVILLVFASLLLIALAQHFLFGPTMTRSIVAMAYHAWVPVCPPAAQRDFVDLAMLALLKYRLVTGTNQAARLLRSAQRDRGLIAAAKECAGLEREEFLAELEHRLVARFAAESLPDTTRHDGAPV